jgi:hypothetical protein
MSGDVGPWVRGRTLAVRASTGLYVATDRSTGRVASIRAPLAGIADDRAARTELAREARIMARLEPHEAILALAADESALSPPRLVLEGGDLTPLAELLSGGALGIDAAVAVVVPIAEALASIHAAGVAHGRISPTCVLVSARGTPKLAMFGDAIAEGLDDAPPRDVAQGDPAWLAPEVLMGDPPTPASDVHALACLFVEIAAGRHPFAGAHDDAAEGEDGGRLGFAESLSRVRDRMGPMLSAGASAALMRAMSKHPADRQRDAAELSADLERWIPAAFKPRPLRDVLGARAGRAPSTRPGAADDEAPSRVAVLPFVVVAAVLALAGVVVLATNESSRAPPSATPSMGRIRILARPWANVSLDGVPLDVTPIGAPIVVTPGRHVLDFAHPSAPKVQRVVDVASGQTVVVDVIIDVPPPAAPSASGEPSP